MTETPEAPEVIIPPVPNNESGFDFFMTPGVDLIKTLEPPIPIPPPTEGTEPEPIPPGWNNHEMDVTGDPPAFNNGQPPINGHTYSMRYWQTRSDYNEESNSHDEEIVYPTWELVSQTFQQVGADGEPANRNVFLGHVGSEDPPREPGQPVYPISYTGVVSGGSIIGTGGIDDGTVYGYVEVFNECDIQWLPRCSTILQPQVRQVLVPLGDNLKEDIPFPYYNVDTINSMVTDPREWVLVRYRVTTVYKASLVPSTSPGYTPPDTGENEYTHIQTIYQYCIQDPTIEYEKMQAILNNGYFTNGFYHEQLYDVNARPNYNSKGHPIGPVIEPQYELDKEASDMTRNTVYKLVNTIWNQNGYENQDQQDAEGAEAVKKVEEETASQVEQYAEIMTANEENYIAEVESIPARQQEYAEVIKANEDKKKQLLRNTRIMMNLDPNARMDIEAAFSNFEQPDFSKDTPTPDSGDD